MAESALCFSSPLGHAVGQSQLECMLALLSAKADPNRESTSKELPLGIAAANGDYECVAALINANAVVDLSVCVWDGSVEGGD